MNEAIDLILRMTCCLCPNCLPKLHGAIVELTTRIVMLEQQVAELKEKPPDLDVTEIADHVYDPPKGDTNA